MSNEPIAPYDELFDSLQAEREEAWLPQVFHRPAGFATFAGSRSVVIFGSTGSGKTALRLMLTRYAQQFEAAQQRLVVQWRPAPQFDLSGTPAARALFEQALGACARELLRHAGQAPEQWRAAPPWVTETGRWFIRSFVPELQRAPVYHLGRLAEEATPIGAALQSELVTGAHEPLFEIALAEEQLVGELANLTRRLGFGGIWIVVDSLERLAEQSPEMLSKALGALFSTLAIFEHLTVTVKIVAPLELAPALRASGGVLRRRIDTHTLEWSPSELEQIVTRRLGAALNRPNFDLVEIYRRTAIVAWLRSNGGDLPRQWLDLGRRLLETYQEHGAERPLHEGIWRTFARERPHTLRIDLAAGLAFVDDQERRKISPASFKLLSYLYKHRDRICTRSELYYLALRGLAEEPRSPDDTNHEDPAVYGGVLDSQLWRLRNEIEPNPKHPIFLRVIRGRGVKLDQAL